MRDEAFFDKIVHKIDEALIHPPLCERNLSIVSHDLREWLHIHCPSSFTRTETCTLFLEVLFHAMPEFKKFLVGDLEQAVREISRSERETPENKELCQQILSYDNHIAAPENEKPCQERTFDPDSENRSYKIFLKADTNPWAISVPEIAPRFHETSTNMWPESTSYAVTNRKNSTATELRHLLGEIPESTILSAQKVYTDTSIAKVSIPQRDLECVEVIAQGTFGPVWKGIWQSKGGRIKVAIKKVYAGFLKQSDLHELCNDINAMVDLHHPFICPVYGLSVTPDGKELWIVRRFVGGGNLSHLLHAHSAPPWRTRLALARCAAAAVDFLHTRDPPIYHRDLKSVSFLVEPPTTLLLTGLALSRVKEEFIGSLRWRAPEALRGEFHGQAKSDIFSLGMVFFEIASGEFPFSEERNEPTVFKMIERGERPFMPKHCPKGFKDIIEWCWDQNPERRPTSSQLVTMLDNLIEQFEIDANG